MKILLAVDGSLYTQRMLSYIAAHDELVGRSHRFTALTVVEPVPGYALHLLQDRTVDRYYLEESERVLDSVRKFAEQQQWSARMVYDVGHPVDAIVAAAHKERADLIVMGSHGRGALGSLLLGSVANGVLARCEVPVMLIR